MELSPDIIDFVCSKTGADRVTASEEIQTLWSGYGSITRLQLHGTTPSSVVVKIISPPSVNSHPRGWNTDYSHQRKLTSYQVEAHWYTGFTRKLQASPGGNSPISWYRLPRCIAALHLDETTCLVLEDLDTQFPVRKQFTELAEAKVCLQWLASFHAQFIGVAPSGLWTTGTYWHLDTRPDEYRAMANGPIKQSAELLDQALASCRYLTLVHGDAKVANFCFSDDAQSVIAVDFQYIGGGCGIKDVAYFLGSCLTEASCHAHETELLEVYFDTLRECLERAGHTEAEQVCLEWRGLYEIAWTDFYRFLLGWMPDHQKINSYTQLMAERALRQLGSQLRSGL